MTKISHKKRAEKTRNIPDGTLLSIGEAAKRLGVSVDTLRRWDKTGILPSFRASEKGYRYYQSKDIFLFYNDLFKLAEEWVGKETGSEPDKNLYCQTNDVFQNRLITFQHALEKMNSLTTHFSLIAAAVGEIGNNSFDHNLGNWRDIPGIFFGYNLEKKYVVLADRGQGILRTLQRVKSELKNSAEALKVAFTEIISGRAPEERGNGLKFVKEIVITNPLKLRFETGDARLTLEKGNQNLTIEEKNSFTQGCIAFLQF